jgi:hypothetical protein
MKGYNGLSIFCAVLLFGAVLVSPAFADKKKVDEADLARINASLTGAFVKNQTADIEKDVRDQERLQASEDFNKDADVSPSVSKKSKTVDQKISDHTTSNFGFTEMNMSVTVTGGINAVKSR